jgi:hypothetical protein
MSGVAKIRELSSAKVTALRTRGIFVSRLESKITRLEINLGDIQLKLNTREGQT